MKRQRNSEVRQLDAAAAGGVAGAAAAYYVAAAGRSEAAPAYLTSWTPASAPPTAPGVPREHSYPAASPTATTGASSGGGGGGGGGGVSRGDLLQPPPFPGGEPATRQYAGALPAGERGASHSGVAARGLPVISIPGGAPQGQDTPLPEGQPPLPKPSAVELRQEAERYLRTADEEVLSAARRKAAAAAMATAAAEELRSLIGDGHSLNEG